LDHSVTNRCIAHPIPPILLAGRALWRNLVSHLATPQIAPKVAIMLPRAGMRTLTDVKIRSLKPSPNGKPFDVKDTQVPGLRVRVLGAQKTFVLLTRYPGSRNPTRRALGAYGDLTLEEARVKARTWRKMIREGVDPSVEVERQRQAVLRQQRTTFAAVAEDFIKEKVLTERKAREIEREVRREFLCRWGRRPLAEITPQDVRDVVKAAKDRGAPYQAHNLLVLARDQQVYGLENSPCARLKPKAIIGKKAFRTRILAGDELRAFWRAANRLGYPYGPLFRLLALTGQRKSEVAKARWSEIDLAQRLWSIPPERMKAGAAHVVPLPDDAIAILKTLPRFGKGDYVFSTTFGTKPVNGFSKAKERLNAEMLLSWRAIGRTRGENRREAEIAPWVIHDIRRTMRTGLSTLAVPDIVRELVIAHTKPEMHQVYDQHNYLDEKRRALDLWAARLRSIVDPQSPDVVPFLARGA
jgi:integrase